jgi:hypothetical protein
MSVQDPMLDYTESDEGLEAEDTISDSAPIKPWDPKKIRITTKNFTLREIADQIKEDEIDLAPDFQRSFVWKQRQRTRLIESVLLGIPLPAFYFNQDREGTYQVVDGVQRLSTIRSFMVDEHTLEQGDLEYLQGLDGLTYSQLEPVLQRRFRSTQIVVHVIEPQTPDEIKYDIFGRVSTLGEPLSAQEIRHAMSKARSREFLHVLVHLNSFDEATNFHFYRKAPGAAESGLHDDKRMTDRELALRFCAFSDFSLEEYRKFENLDAYLVEFTRRIDGRSAENAALSNTRLAELRDAFERAMINANAILGRDAFRRWNPDTGRRGPINRAVFEAQSIALSKYQPDDLHARTEQVRKALQDAFKDPEYVQAVTVSTGDSGAIDLRLRRTQSVLAGVLE